MRARKPYGNHQKDDKPILPSAHKIKIEHILPFALGFRAGIQPGKETDK